jgi:hypothetical protein
VRAERAGPHDEQLWVYSGTPRTRVDLEVLVCCARYFTPRVFSRLRFSPTLFFHVSIAFPFLFFLWSDPWSVWGMSCATLLLKKVMPCKKPVPTVPSRSVHATGDEILILSPLDDA